MDSPNWQIIEKLRKRNRAIYMAIEDLVGKSKAEDATLDLMRRFYEKYPVLARAVHREILRIDLVIYDRSSKLSCE